MTNSSEASSRYLISTVAKRSGVKADLIRAWERRYDAVKPMRTEGGHRVYSDLDIARLKLLNRATLEGHSISQIANLSLEELNKLLSAEAPDGAPVSEIKINKLAIAQTKDSQHLAEVYIDKCYTAMMAFDAKAIEAHFENAVVELGAQAFMEHLLTPLLNKMGDDWQAGLLRPAHEHMTTAVIRSMVYILRSNYEPAEQAPRLVISTPIGQLHELGALIAALIAEFKGWHITYLEPNLPAEEIAFAVKSSRADVVAISITLSSEDHLIPKELRRLKRLLGKDVFLAVGGNAASEYAGLLAELGALMVEDCEHFKVVLDQLAEKIQLIKSLNKE